MKPVGGFFRYGFNMTVLSQHDLDMLNVKSKGITQLTENLELILTKLSGGFKIVIEEVVLRDNLMVFRSHDDAVQVAFGEHNESAYKQWLNSDLYANQGLTYALYIKEKNSKN